MNILRVQSIAKSAGTGANLAPVTCGTVTALFGMKLHTITWQTYQINGTGSARALRAKHSMLERAPSLQSGLQSGLSGSRG